jgi:hypothetical protein
MIWIRPSYLSPSAVRARSAGQSALHHADRREFQLPFGEGEFNPGAGCVYIAWEGGGQCFFPSENQGNKAHEFLKSIHGGPPITLGLIAPAGAHGAFYYRVDNAP